MDGDLMWHQSFVSLPRYNWSNPLGTSIRYVWGQLIKCSREISKVRGNRQLSTAACYFSHHRVSCLHYKLSHPSVNTEAELVLSGQKSLISSKSRGLRNNIFMREVNTVSHHHICGRVVISIHLPNESK